MSRNIRSPCLAEQHRDAQIVIAADVEPAAAKVIQQHYPTVQITAKVTATDVLFEMARLPVGRRVQ
jgi:hypothetical protein